ncbi:MAG: lipopolysaccharide heptosyltransferase II [bacterium]|nr:lipopolysaccharide heptosyltransferase II [Gammaproteobacteria bacterium]HIL96784.1 lipopolysaccharide heptosyltransferase II [Pseudomonadales bacterium]
MSDRILVVSPAWVGDMVMAQTLYKVLREKHPHCEIDVLAPPATLSLVSRMPEVSKGIRFEFQHGELQIGRRLAFGRELKKNQYQQAIILPNSLKSALVPFSADIPVRTGFRGEYRYFLLNDMRLLNRRALPRMIDRFAILGVENGQPLPELQYPKLMINEGSKQALREKLGLQSDKPILGICPGAEFGDAKKWPEQHYARLADDAVERGMQVWIFGGPGDQLTAQQLKALMRLDNLGDVIDLTGKTSLLEAVDLLSCCRLVVSNDSGLMHIASAVDCSVAVIYGSTSPGFTPPLTDKLEIVSLDLPCSPCFKRTCPLKHKDCLNKLLPEELIPLLETSSR